MEIRVVQISTALTTKSIFYIKYLNIVFDPPLNDPARFIQKASINRGASNTRFIAPICAAAISGLITLTSAKSFMRAKFEADDRSGGPE